MAHKRLILKRKDEKKKSYSNGLTTVSDFKLYQTHTVTVCMLAWANNEYE